jgi:nitrite reductase/ring-hydroxylating ferredoxin subunit
MDPATAERRVPLGLIGVALVLAALVIVFGLVRRTNASPGPDWIRVGSTQQVNASHVTFVAGIPAYVVATPDGLIGLYAKSPHLGERVEYCASSGYFEDPMHGSKFDLMGDYALGPAPHGLDRLEVRTVGDTVWIDPLSLTEGAPRGDPRAARPTGPFCPETP